MNTLKQYEIVSDIERLDHPQYFQEDFKCPALDKFFQGLDTVEKIYANKQSINYFFSRMFGFESEEKSLYVRLKWLVYLHQLIESFGTKSSMYGFTQKAFQMYQHYLEVLEERYTKYEKYLSKKLFKPYLRFLYKLCSLKNPDQEIQPQKKENAQGNNIISKLQQKQQNQMMNWYRMYNFEVQTVQTFDKILTEVKPFFSCQYTYINNISYLIFEDIKIYMTQLKKEYKKLNKLRVTSLQLDKLNSKVIQFHENSFDVFGAKGEMIPDFAKQDISDFLLSPLKPSLSALKKNKKTCQQLTIAITKVKSNQTQQEQEQHNQVHQIQQQ